MKRLRCAPVEIVRTRFVLLPHLTSRDFTMRTIILSPRRRCRDGKVTGRMVSGNYFTVLGLKPAAGRLFSDFDDTTENANTVVVLGYGYWQHQFALSPSIIGKDIRLNGYPFTVVGVAPAGFDGDVVGEQMALFVPLSMQPQIVRGRHWRSSGNASWLSLIGRLTTGTTPAQAEANLNTVFQRAVKGGYGAALSSDDRNAIRETHMNIHVSPGEGGVSELRGDYRPGAVDCVRECRKPAACTGVDSQ
jgi:MacB-like periplasmic core domain